MTSAKFLKHGETFQDGVERRRRSRMEMVDAYSPEIRELIHEFGLCVVQSLLVHGVKKPNIIRHLINTILDELSPVRGANSSQGSRAVDRRFYAPKGYRLVPENPTPEMVTASVDYLKHWRASLTADERILFGRTINGRNLPGLPEREKHAARFRAMVAAAPRP